MWRPSLSSVLVAFGGILIALSIGTVAAAQWREWQHRLQEPPGPQEILPETLELTMGQAALTVPGAEPEGADGLLAAAPSLPPEPPTATATPVPTAVPTATHTPTPAPTPTPTADDHWRAALAQLDGVWEADWPAAVERIEAFRAQFPDHAEATEKLYTALVAWGQALIDGGQIGEGIAQLERAQELLPGRDEGAAALRALTPTPTPYPLPVLKVVAAAKPPSVESGRPVWMVIPRIGVNSSVVNVGVKQGVYQVPPFSVGYHTDSATAGSPGNSVFTGHVISIDEGRVFARLPELRPGDAVYVYTLSERLDWVVEAVATVPNTERRYIQPTDDTRITLYTCTGQYWPVVGDFSHRRVVVGRLVRASPRT